MSPNSSSTHATKSQKHMLLLNLPGEIRNQIYELCIQHSVDSLKRYVPQAAYRKGGLLVSVLPRWQGSGRLMVEGIGSIRLLFACKQIYEELSSFILSKTGRLCIGGYILQNPNEDPNIRWQLIHDILAKHPTIRKFVKHVLIRLPSTRHELFKCYWRSIGFPCPPNTSTSTSTPWAVVPSVVEQLRSFSSLRRVDVEVVADGKEVPDLRVLLPLYDICGHETTVRFVPKGFRQGFYWEEEWVNAWDECLKQSGRISSSGINGVKAE